MSASASEFHPLHGTGGDKTKRRGGRKTNIKIHEQTLSDNSQPQRGIV